ncbi:hypothetical protein CHU92_02835 [Flavobacterium cyanobacteriorum]|uniref:Tetratricopeptide repeat protein n=1 Tax=Flavobacterium cyanobacteriorum TaxID=2022802 RepID=A0A255ZQT1_9FLAO|nr:hypothetical protein [Flavobacterium cyanobacteriorum]OYQ43863.1 hypothetical protein CHU92_02835 [Flavobacterium cyanobacteriorum]
MVRLITFLLLLTGSMLSAQSQYDQGMQRAFKFWSEGRNAEAASLFERMASAEKNNWLPNYYVALVNTTQAFETKDREKINALLTKAQAAQDAAIAIAPNEPELLVMQAMIHTAWIAFDPMTNGMKLSPRINELYAKAFAIAPDNPRVVFCKAEFDMGSAKFFGKDIKPLCAQVEKSIQLFEAYKQPSAYYPAWGLDRAKETLAECKK